MSDPAATPKYIAPRRSDGYAGFWYPSGESSSREKFDAIHSASVSRSDGLIAIDRSALRIAIASWNTSVRCGTITSPRPGLKSHSSWNSSPGKLVSSPGSL